MKKWNLKIKNDVQGIIRKLDSTFGSAEGFVFNLEKGNSDSVTFKLRKRGLYAFQILLLNRITVNGTILKSDSEKETEVEILFTQDLFTKLIIFLEISVGLGLSLTALFLGIESNPYLFIAGVILSMIAIGVWFDVKQRSRINIQKYKKLISEVLELKN